MNSGKVFNSDVRDLLLLTARDMVRRQQASCRIKNKYCEGVVETTGARAAIGAISGQLFSANLEIASGKTMVTFLVRSQDLEDGDPVEGEWTDWMNPQEFARHVERRGYH